MTRTSQLRAAIMGAGLLIGVVVAAISIPWRDDPADQLRKASNRLGAYPSESRMRELLNVETDGAYGYLKMALVGRSFAEHPAIFRAVASSPQSQNETAAISLLADIGAGVFEYYPELEPENFEMVYRNAQWLND